MNRIENLNNAVTEVRNLITLENISIAEACRRLDISYQSFMLRINQHVKVELKALSKGAKRSYRKREEPKPKVTPKSELKTYDLNEFPKIIYKVWRDEIIREHKTVKLRFFLRVEGDKYYMLGYEFGSGYTTYQTDEHLYVYHKELPEAIKEFKDLVQKRLNHGIKDEKLGLVKYALQKKEVSEVLPETKLKLPQSILATTPIHLRDGEYECTIGGDIGRIDYGEATFYFGLPGKFEKQRGVKILIKNKEGILTL